MVLEPVLRYYYAIIMSTCSGAVWRRRYGGNLHPLLLLHELPISSFVTCHIVEVLSTSKEKTTTLQLHTAIIDN